MIISPTDADHLYNADEILNSHKVKKIIRTGYTRKVKNYRVKCKYNSRAWCNFNDAVNREVQCEKAVDLNLSTMNIQPGTEYELGNATVKFIAG